MSESLYRDAIAGERPFLQEVYTDTEPVRREAARRRLPTADSLTLTTGFDLPSPKIAIEPGARSRPTNPTAWFLLSCVATGALSCVSIPRPMLLLFVINLGSSLTLL